MRISDWSSDVCSSDLFRHRLVRHALDNGPAPMTGRSNRAEVRNPILGLPSVAYLRALDPAARHALQAVLLDIQRDARQRAEKSWLSRKPPVAAYWAACGV